MATVHMPRRRRPSIQAPVRDASNDDYARTYSCATCMISYQLPRGQQARCPLCQARADVDQLRQALLEANGKLEQQTNELNRLRPQVDLVAAMRQALDLTGPEDRAFIKSVAYRYRAGEPVSLRAVLVWSSDKSRRPRRHAAANGLIAICRGQEETHQCTSIGGLALARYVNAGLASVGPITTMQHVMRALAEHLTPTGTSS